MKRLCFLFIALFCLNSVPSTVLANASTSTTESQTELPWNTAMAILKAVDPQTGYTFDQLVDMYRDGSLKIVSTEAGYLVTFRNADGSLDSVLISNL